MCEGDASHDMLAVHCTWIRHSHCQLSPSAHAAAQFDRVSQLNAAVNEWVVDPIEAKSKYGEIDGMLSMCETIRSISSLHQSLKLFIILRICLRVTHHRLYFFLRQPRGRFNDDRLFLSRSFVFRTDIQDAIRVDIKSHFNLRHSPRCGWYIRQVEAKRKFERR